MVRDSAGLGSDSPDTGALRITGTSAHGVDWAPRVYEDDILLGLPSLGQVRPLIGAMALSGSLSPDDASLRSGVLLGEGDADRFGAAFATLPQPDGSVDLWVGAPDMQGPGTAVGAGAVYRFVDWATRADETLDAATEASTRVLSELAADRLGEVIEACGDHDGDGLPELLVSAPWDSSGAALGGRVHLIDGDEPDTLAREVLSGQLRHSWTSSAPGARLGQAMSCSADLDGDGLADLALGAPYQDVAGRDAAGSVFLLLSGVEHPDGDVSAVSDLTLSGSTANSWFGAAIATGDLSGDGLAELAVGAPGRDGTRGWVSVFEGSALQSGSARPRTRLEGPEGRARLGASLLIADADGDGLADLLAGAPREGELSFEAGAVYRFAGTVGLEGWPSLGGVEDASERLASEALLSHLGAQLASGDPDGDGRAALLWTLATQPE
ncbi:MAG: FG-GAP repeat protein [Deltaproteobacteria bacterium]|nr:FG-GAP repeat protein [Deltaproteobacteria bacterium]